MSIRATTNSTLVAALAAIALGSTAAGQGDGIVYASGILHAPLGLATFGPVDGRRLPVNNIGSSGQDGVEVQLDSAWGGGVGVELPALFTAPAGAEVRIRPKGWDGTIKGNMRLTSNGNGTITCTADLTGMGATTATYDSYDASGNLVSHGAWPPPGGGIVAVPNVLLCPGGLLPSTYTRTHWDIDKQQWVTTWYFGCADALDPIDVSAACRRIDITPGLPPGTPVLAGLSSIQVTAVGLSSITLSEANLSTFGLDCSGLGVAHIDEECIGFPPPCAQADRRLPVRNIGSSGQDGVSVDLSHQRERHAFFDVFVDFTMPASGVTQEAAFRNKDGLTGHVTLIKRTMAPQPGTGRPMMSVDVSGVGSTQYDAVFQSAAGQTLATLRRSSGAPCCVVTSPVPADCVNHDEWSGRFRYHRWRWQNSAGTALIMELQIPTFGVLGGVSRVIFVPVSPTQTNASPDLCDLTSSTIAGLDVVLRGAGQTPLPNCPADANDDTHITPADVAIFVTTWFTSLQQGTLDGDFNGDLAVTPADVAVFVGTWFSALATGSC